MSLQFNNTTTKGGIIQNIERNLLMNDGDISGNVTKLKKFTADVNVALDKAWSIIFNAIKGWNFDDSNHTDYPFITTNLVDGQRDYAFTSDEQGNLILDIYKVMIKQASTGEYVEIFPVDQQLDPDMQGFYDGLAVEGIPTRYDKTANGIFLDLIPSYNSTNGLKIFINREASYFVYSDLTKKPGFAGLFHEYLALRPSYMHAFRNDLKSANKLQGEMLQMEAAIKKYYSNRERDNGPLRITAEQVSGI